MSNSKEIAEITTPAHKAIAKLGGPGIPEIIPQNMDEVWRFSQVVARSGLTPKGIEKPEQITIQMLMGFDLGLKPMVAIQNIHVINNKPCIGGDLALSILLNSGLLEDHDERIEGEGDARVAYCTVTRKGMRPIERKFSVKDAIQAGLWQTEPTVQKTYKDKNTGEIKKSQWSTPNDSPWWRFQDRMLTMRARGFAFRDRFTDVLKGMHLTEEMDIQHEEVRAVSGPSAPPTEEMQDISELPQVEHRREATVPHSVGPSAPPEIEEADIVEGEQRAELRAGEMPGAGDPQDSRENAGIAEGEQDSHYEPFDFATWIQEVRDLVATCSDADALDSVADMFSNTAEEALGRGQRDEYDDVMGTAYTRIAQTSKVERRDDEQSAVMEPAKETSGPTVPPMEDEGEDQDDQMHERTPGDLYEDEIVAEIERDGVTAASLTILWNEKYEGKKHRNAMVKEGTWTAERLGVLRDRVAAKREELIAKEAATTNSPEIPEGSTAGESSGDPKAAFTDTLRARLEACTTPDEVSALSTETLPYRNEIGDPTHTKLWRTMVTKRREALA